MKKFLFCLIFISAMNSKTFNDEKFEKMTDNEKYDYCLSRRNKGVKKHGGEKNHRENKGYLHEKEVCCSKIIPANLTGGRRKIFEKGCGLQDIRKP